MFPLIESWVTHQATSGVMLIPDQVMGSTALIWLQCDLTILHNMHCKLHVMFKNGRDLQAIDFFVVGRFVLHNNYMYEDA